MLLYFIFLIAGILLFAFSILYIRKIRAYLHRCERAVGRVVRREEIDDNEGVYYRPVFEFTTSDGSVITYKHGTSGSSSRYWPVGATQTFLYDPADPASARFCSYGIFQFSVLLTGISLALIAIGTGYFLWRIFLFP